MPRADTKGGFKLHELEVEDQASVARSPSSAPLTHSLAIADVLNDIAEAQTAAVGASEAPMLPALVSG